MRAYSLLLLAMFVLAGCTAAAPDDHHPINLEPAIIGDETGDAYDGQWDQLYYTGTCATIACTDVPNSPDQLRVNAPWFDIVSTEFMEDDDALTVSLQISELTEAMAFLESEDINRFATYNVCWWQTDDHGVRCASLEVDHTEGKTNYGASFVLVDDSCGGYFHVCIWDIPATIEYSSPATIEMTVPKHALTLDGAPSQITSAMATTFWYETPGPGANWHYAISASANGQYQHDHGGPGYFGGRADTLAPTDMNYTFDLGHPEWPTHEAAIAVAGPGAAWGEGGQADTPELDLLESRFWVEDGEAILQTTVASMDQFPVNGGHWDTLIGVSGHSMIEMGVRKDTNTLEAYGYMGRCIGFHCDDVKELRGPVEFEPGTPATLTVRFPVEDFGFDQGNSINFLKTITMSPEASLVIGEHDETQSVDIHTMTVVDFTHEPTPYVIGGGQPNPFVAGQQHEH